MRPFVWSAWLLALTAVAVAGFAPLSIPAFAGVDPVVSAIAVGRIAVTAASAVTVFSVSVAKTQSGGHRLADVAGALVVSFFAAGLVWLLATWACTALGAL